MGKMDSIITLNRSKEHIFSAAYWLPEAHCQVEITRPINIKSGIVITGISHAHCIHLMASFYPIDDKPERYDGFLTTWNRFIGRREAFILAREAGQLTTDHCHHHSDILFSECLFLDHASRPKDVEIITTNHFKNGIY